MAGAKLQILVRLICVISTYSNGAVRILVGLELAEAAIPPTPDGAPNPHFLQKEGFGVQKLPFPLALTQPGKSSFLSKNPNFPCVPL